MGLANFKGVGCLRSVKILALAVLGLGLAACGGLPVALAPGAAPTAAPTHVKLVYTAQVADMVPLFIAQQAGYYQQQGLDVEINYVSGSPVGMAALVSGDHDLMGGPGSAAVSAGVSTDPSSQPVLILAPFNNSILKLMVQSDITSVDQLRGKTLAIGRPGTSDEYELRNFLQSKGIDPSNDVHIIAAGSIDGQLAMMDSKQVDGTLISTPQTAVLTAHGYRTLVDFSQDNFPLLEVGVMVTRGYAEAHPDTVLAFSKAYVQAMHRFDTDKPFSEQAISSFTGVTDQAQLDDAYDTLKAVFLKVPLPSNDAVQHVIDSVPTASGLQASQFIDPSFVQQLQTSGFIDQVYGSS